jgi:hypothetical protein
MTPTNDRNSLPPPRYRAGALLYLAFVLLGATIIGAGARSTAAQEFSNQPLSTPGGPSGLLALAMVTPPRPMLAEGATYLAYELQVTNYQSLPVELLTMRVENGKARFDFDTTALKTMIDLPARYAPEGQELTLAPLATRIVLVWLRFPSPAAIAPELVNHLVYRFAGQGQNSPMAVVSTPWPVTRLTRLTIAPPLRGTRWAAGNGPSNTSSHRRAMFVVDGNLYFPERFAIDFIQVDEHGRSFSGDPKRNASYHCYGAPVLAVAAGKVVALTDGVPDNIPGSLAITPTLNNLGGNIILLDLGHGHYAFYAHLIPGSLKVHRGERVHAGQVLGLLGNSGNSSEPHLHFHLVEGPSGLGAQGIPYGFSQFTQRPERLVEVKDGWQIRKESGAAHAMHDSLMLDGAIVDFPTAN